MREFIKVLKRYIPPYKKYLVMSFVFTFLSAILNVFSFMVIIPILEILFKMKEAAVVDFIPWSEASFDNIQEVVMNNANYFLNHLIEVHGASMTLLYLGLFLIFMTLLKTAAYFASSASIIPLRTGVVRDIRTQLYDKVVSLPLGFFSKERKGDIIARMSGDVIEVENSIASSLDMLIKNPILVIIYFGTLLYISWELLSLQYV